MSSHPSWLHCRHALRDRSIAAVALLGWVMSACDGVKRDYGVEDTNSAANGTGTIATATNASTLSPTSATAAPKPSTRGDAEADDGGSQGPAPGTGEADASLSASPGDTDGGTTPVPPDATAGEPMASEATPGGPSAPSAASSAPAPSSDAVASASTVAPPATSAAPEPPVITPTVLVFSKTAAYRHPSIIPANVALQELAAAKGWEFGATEDAEVFNDNLSDSNVVVFLNTSGELLDDTQQAAMERFIQAGHGFVGVHHAAAADTEANWDWYDGLLGARSPSHSTIKEATVVVEDTSHPSTSHLLAAWVRTDEWFSLTQNPRPQVHVLLTVDESTLTPSGTSDHPIAWYHEYDGGRAFYTAMGHTDASYAEEDFLQHLAGAIEWASGAAATP